MHFPIPLTDAEARRCLSNMELPSAIAQVIRKLQEHGYAAVIVGGAVRDQLCKKSTDDWDVATSATPDEVQGLFSKVILTGVDHGTVTVLQGKGEERCSVEVTTFRGEDEYEDGRRPQSVRFLRELEDDLARRDFTINAMAWDPINNILTDAYGGLADLRNGIIRAVGAARERFLEDGLRSMRALRFAAVLGFAIEQETLAAIFPTLEVFDRVSRERVRVELFKLLAAQFPFKGLDPMRSTGLWNRVLPPLNDDQYQAARLRLARLPADPVLRLMGLLWSFRCQKSEIVKCIEGLKPSREERDRVLRLTSESIDILQRQLKKPNFVVVRKAASDLGRKYLNDAQHLLEFQPSVLEICDQVPLSISELAITGKELIKLNLLQPGPQMGRLLHEVLDWVLEEPERNTNKSLLAHVRSRLENGL